MTGVGHGDPSLGFFISTCVFSFIKRALCIWMKRKMDNKNGLIKGVRTSADQKGFVLSHVLSWSTYYIHKSTLGVFLSILIRGRSSGAQNAEHSKSTAIIIRATLLRTLMAVSILLPLHIHGALLRLEGVNTWIIFPGRNSPCLFPLLSLRCRNLNIAKSHHECISGDVLFLPPLNHQRGLIGEFVLIYIHPKAGKDGAVYLFQYWEEGERRGGTVLAVLNWGMGLVKLMCCEFLVPGLVIEV